MLMWFSLRRPRQPQPALRHLLALPIVVLLYSSASAASSAVASSGEAENPILAPTTKESNRTQQHFTMNRISKSLAQIRLQRMSADALPEFDNNTESGARAAQVASFFDKFHFAPALCEAIYDGPKDQALEHEFSHVRKLNSLKPYSQEINYIRGDVHAEYRNAALVKIIANSDAIIKIADNLLTESREGRESDSLFDSLVRTCRSLSFASLGIIRAYHVPASEQDSILRCANYDPRIIEDVHLALALMLAKLLRADDISRLVLGLASAATAGGDWRSRLLKIVSDGEAGRTAVQDYMIADARAILNDFRAGIQAKLREGAPEAQESKKGTGNSSTNIVVVLAIASAVLLLLISIFYIVRRRYIRLPQPRNMMVSRPGKTDAMA